MAQEIIKNLTADTLYTLPQQYTTVETGIVNATSGNSFITITSFSDYIDYLMTILFRSNTGVQFPKVYILLVQPLDARYFELVSIVSFYKLSDTELVLNVGRELTNSYAAADLLTVQIDAQYSDINIQAASYTGKIAVLDQAQIILTAAVPPSFNNNFAGGPPMAIYGAPVTVAVTGGGGDRISVDPVPPLPLRLTWDDIGNALYTTVGDYNTLLGSDFTTLTVDGNDQLLTGNSTTFAMPASAFLSNANIVSVDDEAESVTSLGDSAIKGCSALTTAIFPVCTSLGQGAFSGCAVLTTATFPLCTSLGKSAFDGCSALTTVTLPVCTSVGANAFDGCTALTTVTMPLCADLGGTTGDDTVFGSIGGQTITLTIAASRETCDGGNPDGDIVYLSANNTATIIYV